MKRTLIIPLLLVAICLFAEDVTPYFTTPEMPNALRYLPAPPKTNEMRYAYDTAQYQWGKSVRNTPRGQKARLDAAYSVQRMAEIFSPIMGVAISKTNTPQLWKLLMDATKTTSFACDSAKITYMRKRPYMVFHEPTLVPEDEEELSHNGSYPSGHCGARCASERGIRIRSEPRYCRISLAERCRCCTRSGECRLCQTPYQQGLSQTTEEGTERISMQKSSEY